jgi:hypothetical protein
MSARTRQRNDGLITGTRSHPTWGVVVQNSYSSKDKITDRVVEGSGQPLTITKVRQVGGILNRTSTSPFVYSFHNYRCDAIAGIDAAWFQHGPIIGKPTDAALATRLLADTNPSRPVVDLPIFVAELRELPRLLRLEGDTLLKRAGSANLGYQFGWRPLIGDLTRLLSFSDQVAKRETELKNLFKSGLRRKRQLYSGAISDTFSSVLNSTGFNTGSVPYDRVTKDRTWGFVEWYPTVLPPATSADMRSLARRAVLGMTVDLSTAWELIPWSWLVDWCSNVGDFLSAQRNIIGATHGPVQIMSHTTTQGKSRVMPVQVSPHEYTYETKTRNVVTPSLSAYLPFLSLRQLSILGSIGVTRRMPRS